MDIPCFGGHVFCDRVRLFVSWQKVLMLTVGHYALIGVSGMSGPLNSPMVHSEERR